jgi:release factor glutamine methyltransferase
MNKINFEKQKRNILIEKYFGKEIPEYFNDVEKLKKGEPLDYIIGWKPFLNCLIDLSFKPLIPRVETEYWVEKAIKEIKKRKGLIKVLDIFSGSGCIGISILKNCLNVEVDFAEIDSNLIKQIEKNLKINKISSKRYNIFQSDIFSNLKNKYDVIVANPPYISLKRREKVEKQVLKYEPKKSLFGGKDGLFFIRKFLKKAKNYLNLNGEIWLEFDSFQKKDIEILLRKFNYSKWNFFKDQYNKWRFVKIW